MNVFNILRNIYKHPLNKEQKAIAIIRFFKWQLNTRLNPYPILYPVTKNAKMFVWRGLTGATGNLYCGLMEFEDMGYLLHYLNANDLFVDIGANVGIYTILASGEIKARTIAIEPIPMTYKFLNDNLNVNGITDKVVSLNIGLGKQESTIQFTKSLDTVNHVAVEGEDDVIDIAVKSLDDIITEIPNFLKLDVEGFETEVLLGASRVLSSPELNTLVIELNGSGNRYGYNDIDIHKTLLKYGFKPFKYNPFFKELSELSTYNKVNNTIYIKDVDEARNRIKQSQPVELGNGSLI